MPHIFRSVFHPTSFSGAQDAFAHALRIALAARGELRLVHVHAPHDARAVHDDERGQRRDGVGALDLEARVEQRRHRQPHSARPELQQRSRQPGQPWNSAAGPQGQQSLADPSSAAGRSPAAPPPAPAAPAARARVFGPGAHRRAEAASSQYIAGIPRPRRSWGGRVWFFGLGRKAESFQEVS
mgnify:CR=1 FL=1